MSSNNKKTLLRFDHMSDQAVKRLVIHVIVAFYFLSLYVIFRNTNGVFPVLHYKLLGALSFVILFLAGLLALIKYDTSWDPKYVFAGFGFLGSSVTSLFYYLVSPNLGLDFGLPDSSLLLLSIMIFISCLSWELKSLSNSHKSQKDKTNLFLLAMFLAIFLTILFIFYESLAVITVPFSILLLVFSVYSYLKKGLWKSKYYDQIIITSIVLLGISAMPFYTSSMQPMDLMFYMSVIIKLTSYVLMLVSLLLSVHSAFVLAEKFGETTEATLATSIETLPVGYVVVDPSGNIKNANNKICQYFGVKSHQKIKNILVKHFSFENIAEQLTGDKKEVVINNISFQDKYFNLLAAEISISEKNLGIVVLVEDVTTIRSFEKSKSEFIALTSHELRSPLVAIQGNIELLKDLHPKIVENKNTKSILTDIESSNVKMMGIVNQLLEVTSLEQKKFNLQLQKFNINEAISQVLADIHSIIVKKGLEIRFDEAEKMDVYADFQKSVQILSNLIGNAVKFTDKGYVAINVSGYEDGVKIKVSDTGRGIKNSDQKDLFKKFKQVGDDVFKHDSSQGIGLGLYISKTLAKKMGGDLKLVKSVVGKGSEFELRLPKA